MRARRTCVALCALVLAATAACSSAETPADEVVGSAPTAAENLPQADADEAAEPSEPAAEPSGAAEDDDAASAPDEMVTIMIVDFAFVVPPTVAPGAEVTVINKDASYHTVTADDGAFDVGARQGQPVTFTAPSEPGEYTFHCGPHPNMVATLVVG